MMLGQSGTNEHAKDCAPKNASEHDQTDGNGTHEPLLRAAHGYCAMLYNLEQNVNPKFPAVLLHWPISCADKDGSSQPTILLNPAVTAGIISDCRDDGDIGDRSAVGLHILTLTQFFALRRLVFFNAPDEASTLPDSRSDFKRVGDAVFNVDKVGDTEIISQCFWSLIFQ
jgi:hypothetical protein